MEKPAAASKKPAAASRNEAVVCEHGGRRL